MQGVAWKGMGQQALISARLRMWVLLSGRNQASNCWYDRLDKNEIKWIQTARKIK